MTYRPGDVNKNGSKGSDFLYLPGLNGIRAIAAIAVVILHTCSSLKNIGLYPAIFGAKTDGSPLVYTFGSYAVTIFFVLSGFLITYLLLLEKDKQEINVRKFYLRRMFRIWPLYYGFFFAALLLVLVSGIPFNAPSVIFYIFLIPNLIAPSVTPIPFVNHFWSIGVEEQFYLFWPWVVKQRAVKIMGPVLAVIILMFSARLYLNHYYEHSTITHFLSYSRFDCMLIGAAGAILYKNKTKWFIKLIDNRAAQIITLILGVLYSVNAIHITDAVNHLIICLITLSVIIGQINVKNRIVNLDTPVFRYLGKISFGLYVYHQLFIFVFTKLYKNVLYDGLPKYCLMFFSVFAATIIVSHLSYTYFESWFVRRKDRYAIIHSANAPVKKKKEIKERVVQPEEAYAS